MIWSVLRCILGKNRKYIEKLHEILSLILSFDDAKENRLAKILESMYKNPSIALINPKKNNTSHLVLFSTRIYDMDI